MSIKDILPRTKNIYFFSFKSFFLVFILFSSPSTDQRLPASEEAMHIWSRHGRAIKTFNLLQAQLIFALTLVVLLSPMGQVTGQGESETQLPAQVLQELLDRHGENSTITVPQLRALLELLSKGQGEGDGDSSNVAETPATTPPKTNSSKVRTKTTEDD